MIPTTLWEHYQQKGQKMPTWQERMPIAKEAGISDYIGTEQQNKELLAYLQKPITSSQGKPPEQLIDEIEGEPTVETTPAPKVYEDSEALRIKKKAEAIKEGFGIGEKPAPSLFEEADKTKLKTAQVERETIQTRSEEILAEKLKLQEEWRNFTRTTGEGVSEFGRARIESEEGRKIQDRLDALNREELVLETKLRNRNTVISEMMNVQRQDYQDAVNQYNTQFSQAIQLYSLFDKEDDELKINSKANLEVMFKTFEAQIKAGAIDFNDITRMQQAKIEEYETQANLPLGSTMAVLQTIKPDEEKLYSGIDKAGNFIYITKDIQDNISIKKMVGVAEMIPGISGEGTEDEIIRERIKALPVGQQEGAFSSVAVLKNAKDIYDLLDEGVKTGPISGLKQRAGQVISGENILFNEFKAATTAFTANFIKALSGVQVSDKERKYLMGSLPTEYKQEQVNRDNIKTITKFIKNKYSLQLGISLDGIMGELDQERESELEDLFNQYNE